MWTSVERHFRPELRCGGAWTTVGGYRAGTNSRSMFIFAGRQDMHFFAFGSGFCHLCSFWEIGLPLRMQIRLEFNSNSSKFVPNSKSCELERIRFQWIHD